MATALNEQIKWEMYSANLYLAMSAYLQDAGLTGFSHWMRIQYQEETAHALKFYDFLLSRGGQVTMLSIDAPNANWSNILEILKKRCPTNRKLLAESTSWCILPRKNGISPRIFSCNGLSPNRWKRKKPSRTSSANYAWLREKDRECWFWTRICQPAPLRRLPPTSCCYCSPSILRKRVPEKIYRRMAGE